MDLVEKASKRIAERLSWCTAHRDQIGIAKDLADAKDISEVYGLGEAGLFDEFFYFLDQIGIIDLFNKLDPEITTRVSNVKFPDVILIYLMRIKAGLFFFWHIHPVILRFQSLMRLVGFSGREIRDCTCNSGTYKTSSAKPSKEYDKQTTEIRGAISVWTPLPPQSRQLLHML